MVEANTAVEVNKKRQLEEKWAKTHKSILKERKGEDLPFFKFRSSDFSIGLREQNDVTKTY